MVGWAARDHVCSLAAMAQRLYDERRARSSLLSVLDLTIAEPVWDILLTAFVAAERDAALSVTAACEAAAAPISTALRAIYLLERKKVVRLIRDPKDRRRSFVRLSDEAVRGMTAYLEHIGGGEDSEIAGRR